MNPVVKFFDRVGAWAYGRSDFELWTIGGFAIVAVLLLNLALAIAFPQDRCKCK